MTSLLSLPNSLIKLSLKRTILMRESARRSLSDFTFSVLNLAGDTRDAITQALEFRGTVVLPVKPAAHLHALVHARQPLDIEGCVNIGPQCLRAAEGNPGTQLVGGHAEGHLGTVVQRGGLG